MRTQADRDDDLAIGRELERKDAEIERLRGAIARFADRRNWYFEGDHMCPEWTGKDFPWEFAAAILNQQQAEGK